MTNSLKFAKRARSCDQDTPKTRISLAVPRVKTPGAESAVLKAVWVIIALVWPMLKWVIALDCALQLVRMIYHWNSPGVYAGWTFLLHFGVLTAFTCFVSLYKPKGL